MCIHTHIHMLMCVHSHGQNYCLSRNEELLVRVLLKLSKQEPSFQGEMRLSREPSPGIEGRKEKMVAIFSLFCIMYIELRNKYKILNKGTKNDSL